MRLNQACQLKPEHLVFTLPHALNGLIRQNRRELYNLLLEAASQTLLEFGRARFKAHIGVTAVLHTWSRTLLDHYHLHCIVTGGGVALDGRQWNGSGPHFLFPIKALSRMFRAKFLAGLKQRFDAGQLEFHGSLQSLAQPAAFAALARQAARPGWVVYAKRPFAGPQQVLAYLSRYTHRVAISNHRILSADEHAVTFAYKDYADEARRKQMTLAPMEFIRRSCLHVLPPRFVKVRHYGLLGNRQRQQRLARVRELLKSALPVPQPATRPAQPPQPNPTTHCPHCGEPALMFVGRVARPRRPRRRRSAPQLDSS